MANFYHHHRIVTFNCGGDGVKPSRRRSTTGQVWLVAGVATVAFGLLIWASL